MAHARPVLLLFKQLKRAQTLVPLAIMPVIFIVSLVTIVARHVQQQEPLALLVTLDMLGTMAIVSVLVQMDTMQTAQIYVNSAQQDAPHALEMHLFVPPVLLSLR